MAIMGRNCCIRYSIRRVLKRAGSEARQIWRSHGGDWLLVAICKVQVEILNTHGVAASWRQSLSAPHNQHSATTISVLNVVWSSSRTGIETNSSSFQIVDQNNNGIHTHQTLQHRHQPVHQSGHRQKCVIIRLSGM